MLWCMACDSMGKSTISSLLFLSLIICRYDGQAGAAGITLEEHSPAFEKELMSKLYPRLKKNGVPSYAFPRLVRITEK